MKLNIYFPLSILFFLRSKHGFYIFFKLIFGDICRFKIEMQFFPPLFPLRYKDGGRGKPDKGHPAMQKKRGSFCLPNGLTNFVLLCTTII